MILYWIRWWVCYFTPLTIRRIRYCRHGHAGPFYDGGTCLMCFAPWFGQVSA